MIQGVVNEAMSFQIISNKAAILNTKKVFLFLAVRNLVLTYPRQVAVILGMIENDLCYVS